MQGYYHSIERFGTVDGLGIRYVLFLAGCQLRCRFCHNPDTWLQGKQTITTEKILADVLRYRHFYDASGGGITITGGEPLLQPQFVAELLACCQEHKIHTTIDTAGHCDQSSIAQILPYTNDVLFSIKAVDPQKHHWLAGFDNSQIITNLRYMCQHVPITIRYVILPGITNLPEDIQALISLIRSLPKPVPVELLAYHTYGRQKWRELNMNYALDHIPEATSEDVAAVAALLMAQNITVISR